MASLDLSGYSYQALIFDCDGTLVHSGPLHYRALRESLRAQGLDISEQWYYQRLGLSRPVLFQAFEREFGVTIDRPAAENLGSRIYTEISPEVHEISLIASIARSHYGNIPMAVASGGESVLTTASLRATGLLSLFDHIVTINDVGEGKPSPALFLEAARRLRTPPASCLIFEDSEEGLEAARRANIQAIDVRPHLKAEMMNLQSHPSPLHTNKSE